MNKLNKILVCGTAVVATLAISASTTQAQNLLANPGFESAPFVTGTGPNGSISTAEVGLGWDNNFGGGSQNRNDMSSSLDSPQSGSYAMLAANAPANAWNPQGSYQIIANSSVGAAWTASIWALTDTGILGSQVAGTGPVDFQVTFLNSSFAGIANSTVETGWSAIAQNDIWQQYNLNGIVPANTAYIAVYAMAMIGASPPPTDVVNVYFDTASLQVAPIPEPTTLALAGLGGAAALGAMIRRRKS